MKKKLQDIIVNDLIYGFDLVVLVGDKQLIYDRLIQNKVKQSEADDFMRSDVAGMFINSEDSGIRYQIIVLRSNSIYDLIHEIEHHTFYVLNKVGIPINIETDEAFTYYSGYILSQVLPKIKHHGTRTKNKNTRRTRK